jgi:hypothetical protein
VRNRGGEGRRRCGWFSLQIASFVVAVLLPRSLPVRIGMEWFVCQLEDTEDTVLLSYRLYITGILSDNKGNHRICEQPLGSVGILPCWKEMITIVKTNTRLGSCQQNGGK